MSHTTVVVLSRMNRWTRIRRDPEQVARWCPKCRNLTGKLDKAKNEFVPDGDPDQESVFLDRYHCSPCGAWFYLESESQ